MTDSSLLELQGVGQATAEKFGRLGVVDFDSLIHHFPRRFIDYSTWKLIGELRVGDTVTFRGRVKAVFNRRTKRRRFTLQELTIADESGEIRLIFFNQRFVLQQLREGVEAVFSGTVDPDFQSRRSVKNPVFEVVRSQDQEFLHVGRIVPIYALTEGLYPGVLRRSMKAALTGVGSLSDILPESIQSSQQLLPLATALREIHFPSSVARLQLAKQRLAFDELFLTSLRLRQAVLRTSGEPSVSIPTQVELIRQVVSELPFTLTDGQRRAAWAIMRDLARNRPMQRLLNGEVGSGKTVVAALAALNAIAAGHQVALLAPTEVLARQHRGTLAFFERFGVKLALLTGSTKESITDANLFVGTHALLEDRVVMPQLAFIIIDEQHRFGVEQRMTMLRKRREIRPHLLSMTATPIPRTLALSLYGNLNISILDELPAARQLTTTEVVDSNRPARCEQVIGQELAARHQVFVVTPVIESTTADQLLVDDRSAVVDAYRSYRERFPTAKVGMLHGRLGSRQKQLVMERFVAGKLDILVSTTVIEVGVDVPNATVMVIEGAEHFGLSQLHQLRGRVGRHTLPSWCFLVPSNVDGTEIERLQMMTTESSGFRLAEYDLQLRGPGQFFGTNQSGFPELRLASFANLPLVKAATESAEQLLADDPTLERQPFLKEKLATMFTVDHLE